MKLSRRELLVTSALKASLRAFDRSMPGFAGNSGQEANVYVRPHELDIERQANGVPSLPARVLRLNPAGAVAKVEQRLAKATGYAAAVIGMDQELEADLGIGVDDPHAVRADDPHPVGASDF